MDVLPARRRMWRRCSLLLGALFLIGFAVLAVPHLRAWYHIRAAESDLARYHFADARTHLAICLREWPNSWRVHLLAARAARQDGASGEAEQHLHRCQELQPTSEDVLLEWALLHAASGDLASVEQFLWDQVRHGSAQTPLIWGALIEGYVRMYRISDALACLEGWLKRQPEDTQALFLQGSTWQQAQRPLSALVGYRRVLELDPQRDDARWRLAQCLLKVGTPDEAVAHLEYLHPRHPENVEMTVELACGQFKQGQVARARQSLDAVLANHPDCVSALTERSRLELADGEPAQAEKWLRQVLEHNPEDAQASRLLQTSLLKQGKRSEADSLDARLSKLDEDFKRLEQICLHELGQGSRDPALHYELSTLLLRLGYRDAGRAWLLSALNLDPNYAPAHDALGRADRPEPRP